MSDETAEPRRTRLLRVAEHIRTQNWTAIAIDFCEAAACRVDPFPYVLYSLGMKRSGKQSTRGAEEARQQLPAILAAAAAGRTTIITRHGREIAAVIPATALKSSTQVSLLDLAGSGKGLWGKDPRAHIARLRDEWTR